MRFTSIFAAVALFDIGPKITLDNNLLTSRNSNFMAADCHPTSVSINASIRLSCIADFGGSVICCRASSAPVRCRLGDLVIDL